MSTKPSRLPKSARCVIVGGGVAGVSTAYHLALRGWTDTVVLERDKLTSGTTWHAAGLVGRIGGSPRITAMRKYGAELYAELEETTGMSSGYIRNGGVTVATDKFRLDLIREWISRANAQGVEAYEIGPEETKERAPLLNTADVIASLWSPGDGQINPVDSTMMVAEAAQMLGATVLEDSPVTAILTNDHGAVCGVETAEGRIDCEFVCLAGGMWSRQIAAELGASIPLWPCEHEYVLTEPIEGIKGMPVIRSYDESIYLKEDAGKLLIGLFEPNARPAWRDSNEVPMDFSFGSFPDDLEHLEPYLVNAMHRIPAVETTPISTYFSGPESFTPDGSEMLGETPEVKRLFVCTGFNSHGIVCGPAAGKYVADWIVDGTSGRKVDTLPMDVARFQGWQSMLSYIRPVAAESLGKQYNRNYPHQQRKFGRNQNFSPIHDGLDRQGAIWGAAGGYERPLWYDMASIGKDETVRLNMDGDQRYFAHVEEECRACRTHSVLFDLSSFSKFTVEGPDASAQLERICSAKVDRGIGRTVYTLFLNELGGIETACVVAKLGHDSFMVTGGSSERTKMHQWLRDHLDDSADVKLTDETSNRSIIAVTGPTSRMLLESVIGDGELASEALPFGAGQWMSVGGHQAWVQKLSYAGELGFELYTKADDAADIHAAVVHAAASIDATADADSKIGLRHAGAVAQNLLRLEKGFVHYGHDVNAKMSPSQAGMGFAVSPRKQEYIGRDVHLADLANGVQSIRHMFSVDGLAGPSQLIPTDSPVYDRDSGSVVGEVSSSGWSFGYTTGVIMAHVDASHLGKALELEVGKDRFKLEHLADGALHDPSGALMRG